MKPKEVKIEKNIQKPDRYAVNSVSKWSAALKTMQPGDSFVYPGKSVSNMYIYAKCAGIKISTHKLDDGTFRIWRDA